MGQSLVYEDTSTLNHSDDPTIIIPLEDSSVNSDILYGNYWSHIYIMEDPRPVELADPGLEDQSCLLKLETKNEGSEVKDFYYDVRYDEMVPKFSATRQPLCKLNQNPDVKVSNFNTYLNETLPER